MKEPSSILLCRECLASSQDTSLSLQRQIIRSLLALPDSLPREDLPVQGILESLNETIVFDEASVLKNLTNAHSLRYFFKRNDPRSVPSLIEAGRRILTGKQNAGDWDYGISLVLLRMHCNDSARALGILADITETEQPLDNRVGVLLGFVSTELWQTSPYKRTSDDLPGVLRILDDRNAPDEISSICRFIGIASKTTYDYLLKLEEPRKSRGRFITPHLIAVPPPKLLNEKLTAIANSENKLAAGFAQIAITNVSELTTLFEGTED